MGAHSLAIKTNGTLWACGQGIWGKLGLGDQTNRYIFTQVGTSTDWIQVTAGMHHTVARKNNGQLWAFGLNVNGALGQGTNDYHGYTLPLQIGTSTDWVQVIAGGVHNIALKNNATLWTWGDNLSGQLGLGDGVQRNIPTQVGQ